MVETDLVGKRAEAIKILPDRRMGKYRDPMEAVLYSRWSSLEQKGNTSEARQLELTEESARKNGDIVIERLVDSGKSAWTGENLLTGALGRFADRCRTEGAHGKVLIVEKLDRLSRQRPMVMANWIQEMVRTGLTIRTADGRHTICQKTLDDPFPFMMLIFEYFRGFEESQTKSERVATAWAKKRDRGTPMTRRCPGWLTIEVGETAFNSTQNQNAKYVEIPERVVVVKRIFDMTESGMGKAAIAATLNREGEQVFGRGKCWHASYIQKIIQNPAVIGECQFFTKPKGRERRPTGEVHVGYFPAVITIEQFERVNDARASRVLAQQSSGEKLVNLLTGLTECNCCSGPMTLVSKGRETLADGSILPRRYLRCSSAHLLTVRWAATIVSRSATPLSSGRCLTRSCTSPWMTCISGRIR